MWALLTNDEVAGRLGLEGGDAMPTFGERLREIRETAEITAEAVAKEMGYHLSYVTQIETGKRRMPDGFAGKYMDALQTITRRRAEAVGLLIPTDQQEQE